MVGSTNVQKEIGFYVYPGKIIGIGDYTSKSEKEVHVIMEGSILNGELLLSKDYETYAWVSVDRMKDYPLVPWLNNYVHNNKKPFKDVETEIEELTNKHQRRREIIQEDIMNNINSGNNTEKLNEGVKSSFGLLKDTIKKTFHPREAQVTQTTPKTNELYQEPKEESEKKESIADKLNFRRKKDETKEEYVDDIVLENHENDIIVEHDDVVEQDNVIEQEEVIGEEIIIEHDDTTEEIIIDNTETLSEDIIVDKTEDEKEITPEVNKEVSDDEIIIKPISGEKEKNVRKVFDMNINKQQNMKETEKAERPAEPEIKIIRKNDETPHIRTEKESKEKVSFNSENIRSGWRERLNRINRTDANDEKKEVPRPKGQRK